HSHGLGVAAVGRDPAADVRVLVEEITRNGQETSIVRQFFGTLGEALLSRPREARMRVEAAGLTELSQQYRTEIDKRRAENDRLGQALTEHQQRVEELQRRLERT